MCKLLSQLLQAFLKIWFRMRLNWVIFLLLPLSVEGGEPQGLNAFWEERGGQLGAEPAAAHVKVKQDQPQGVEDKWPDLFIINSQASPVSPPPQRAAWH